MSEKTKEMTSLPVPSKEHIPGLGLLHQHHPGNSNHESDHEQQPRQDTSNCQKTRNFLGITRRPAHIPGQPHIHQKPLTGWESRPDNVTPYQYFGWHPHHGYASHLTTRGENPIPLHLQPDVPFRGPHDAFDVRSSGTGGLLGSYAISQDTATVANQRTGPLKQINRGPRGGTNHKHRNPREMKNKIFPRGINKFEYLDDHESHAREHPIIDNVITMHPCVGQTLKTDENVHASRRAAVQRTVGTIPSLGSIAHQEDNENTPLYTQAIKPTIKPATTSAQVEDEESKTKGIEEVRRSLSNDHDRPEDHKRHITSVREARVTRIMNDTGLSRDTAGELADSELEREAKEAINGRKKLRGYK